MSLSKTMRICTNFEKEFGIDFRMAYYILLCEKNSPGRDYDDVVEKPIFDKLKENEYIGVRGTTPKGNTVINHWDEYLSKKRGGLI